MKLIRRSSTTLDIGKGRTISGYINLFEPMLTNDSHYEVFAKDAFKNADMSNTILASNHDTQAATASTSNGTLKISFKDKGLYFTANIIEGADGDRVLSQVKGGVSDQVSLGAYVDEDRIITRAYKGKRLLTFTRVLSVRDVAPTYNGAWKEATIVRNRTFGTKKRSLLMLRLLCIK